MEINYWKELLEFIREKPIGKVIYRKDIMESLDPMSQPTIDVYRRILTAIGYLEEYKRGSYKIIKYPNKSLSLSEAQREYKVINDLERRKHETKH